MVTLTVDTNAALAVTAMRNGQKRRRYVIANAINKTAKAAQAAVRQRADRVFTVRKGEFIRRQVAIIKPFASATQGTFFAIVGVGQRQRLLLPGFEKGAERKPFKGKRVAVPLIGGPARPSKGAEVPATLTFRALKLTKVRAGTAVKAGKRVRRKLAPGSKPQIKGALGTFVIRASMRQPDGGVYQRVGPGKDDVRLVYPFDASPKRLRPVLEFLKTAAGVAGPMLKRQLRLEVLDTFRYHLTR